MATKTINRANNIVTIGRTAPIPRGQASAAKSLPVVLASDQAAIPVEEQNKIQSEVALSLLGIPRSEVALGIFADVNTYDVDPSEWTFLPAEKTDLDVASSPYELNGFGAGGAGDLAKNFGYGLSHVPEEAGALLEAAPNKTAVLTSKRFFRYQPGRVSAATFGVKTSKTPGAPVVDNRNAAIRKYGIYDKFDGYYWETRDTGKGDQFCVVRRTHALIKYRGTTYGTETTHQKEDYGVVGKSDGASFELSLNTVEGNKITINATNGAGAPQIGMSLSDITAADDNSNYLIAPNTIVTSLVVGANTTDVFISQDAAFDLLESELTAAPRTLIAHYAGDLAIVRDGLLMTHAAMYDPSLLKKETKHKIQDIPTLLNGVLTITLNNVDGLEKDQIVRYNTTDLDNALFEADPAPEAPAASHTSLLRITEVVGTTIKVVKAIGTGGDVDIVLESGVTIDPEKQFIITPVPFIFPEYADEADADIMFPYRREHDINLVAYGDAADHVGAIDTSVFGSSDVNEFNGFVADIDAVNNGELCISLARIGDTVTRTTEFNANQQTRSWRHWIRHNVDPKYYGVYEYRIPRSRFNFDFLDGSTNKSYVYSDVVRLPSGDGESTIQYPGQGVAGKKLDASAWDIDFSKVIMNKIEFSWYGAVGALFLAYVPVGNDEARWVRIHHIRASNQLKVASLGNATLPITYTVYGGGTEKTLGGTSRPLGDRISYAGGKSHSEFVIKYGSSYYIDGGDRGTVRLFNYAPEDSTEMSSSSYADTGSTETGILNTLTIENTLTANTIELSGTTSVEIPDDILMGAKVVTSNPADVNLRVEFIERDIANNTSTLYLNTDFNDHGSLAVADIKIISKSSPVIYGLTSKTEIESSQGYKVRNRVQVYPTKLSVGMTSTGAQSDNVKLELVKNAIYQTDDIFIDGSNYPATGEELVIKSGPAIPLAPAGLPTRLSYTTAGTEPFVNLDQTFSTDFAIGDKVYGWFRVLDVNNPGAQRSLFGFVERVDPINSGSGLVEYEFRSLDTYTEELTFDTTNRTFLYAKQYNEDGSVATAPTNIPNSEIERLSSIEIVNTKGRPIAGTGTQIATFFLQNGSEYFDLSSYFDYNKDYISFPLTDLPDNLYLSIRSSDVSAAAQVNASITWEEQ